MTYNFSSGPAVLPDEVISQIAQELPNWHGTGMPVMTLSHRDKLIADLMDEVTAKMRAALSIPDTHEVLYIQGGGMGQFAGVPLNLTKHGDEAAFLLTGHWGRTALTQAGFMGLRPVAASDQSASRYTTIPTSGSYTVSDRAKYLWYVPNETIQGVEFTTIPESPVPVVADASSQILSQPMDISAFGVVFAGTQKNLGVPGAAVVIVDKSLIGHARRDCPVIFDYAAMAAESSRLNTPPTFTIYVLGLMLDWVEAHGGVVQMREDSVAKSGKLYSLIDGSPFYSNPVALNARSTKNIPFTLADPSLDATFLSEASDAGLAFLAGHRSVGGMRASLYNAMPMAGVDALTGFMEDFERRYG